MSPSNAELLAATVAEHDEKLDQLNERTIRNEERIAGQSALLQKMDGKLDRLVEGRTSLPPGGPAPPPTLPAVPASEAWTPSKLMAEVSALRAVIVLVVAAVVAAFESYRGLGAVAAPERPTAALHAVPNPIAPANPHPVAAPSSEGP